MKILCGNNRKWSFGGNPAWNDDQAWQSIGKSASQNIITQKEKKSIKGKKKEKKGKGIRMSGSQNITTQKRKREKGISRPASQNIITQKREKEKCGQAKCWISNWTQKPQRLNSSSSFPAKNKRQSLHALICCFTNYDLCFSYWPIWSQCAIETDPRIQLVELPAPLLANLTI